MASQTPLAGPELIDCARANVNEGIEVAASRCGYGNDIEAFELALQKSGQALGLEINEFKDLTPGYSERSSI